jgi:hypothetical protein
VKIFRALWSSDRRTIQASGRAGRGLSSSAKIFHVFRVMRESFRKSLHDADEVAREVVACGFGCNAFSRLSRTSEDLVTRLALAVLVS